MFAAVLQPSFILDSQNEKTFGNFKEYFSSKLTYMFSID